MLSAEEWSSERVRGSANLAFCEKIERAQILEAIFDLSRDEIVKRVQASSLNKTVLAAYDYVHDIFLSIEKEQSLMPSQGKLSA